MGAVVKSRVTTGVRILRLGFGFKHFVPARAPLLTGYRSLTLL